MQLTKNSPILEFDEVYALKLIKGTPARIEYLDGEFKFPDRLDEGYSEWLQGALPAFGVQRITVDLVIVRSGRMFVTDVQFNGNFLPVEPASAVAGYLRLRFLPYKKMKTTSFRRIKKYSPVQLRPPEELVTEDGERMVYEYRRAKGDGR